MNKTEWSKKRTSETHTGHSVRLIQGEALWDLRDRLGKARTELTTLADRDLVAESERDRLIAKAGGVSLAIRYVEEMLRG